MTAGPSSGAAYVESLKQVIARFQETRADVIQRRTFASDAVREHIDERLSINAQSLRTLNRAVDLAKKELT